VGRWCNRGGSIAKQVDGLSTASNRAYLPATPKRMLAPLPTSSGALQLFLIGSEFIEQNLWGVEARRCAWEGARRCEVGVQRRSGSPHSAVQRHQVPAPGSTAATSRSSKRSNAPLDVLWRWLGAWRELAPFFAVWVVALHPDVLYKHWHGQENGLLLL